MNIYVLLSSYNTKGIPNKQAWRFGAGDIESADICFDVQVVEDFRYLSSVDQCVAGAEVLLWDVSAELWRPLPGKEQQAFHAGRLSALLV